ncbi:MAG: cyclase family protein [Mariniphaga sp.]|nr:cyclase family protein [Mariniphaga sp.]
MPLFDLSHSLNNDVPVYPGTPRPLFEPSATFETDGYKEMRLSFHTHLGTHIDAPAHMLEDGKTMDQLPLEIFTGKALIIPVPANRSLIDQDFLSVYTDSLAAVDFVLFKTGWSKRWGSPGYFEGFPVLTDDAADWLLGFTLKGIGFDAISVDPVETSDYPNHVRLLKKELILIENLIFPDELVATTGHFSCFPLPLEHADGSPVRAILNV